MLLTMPFSGVGSPAAARALGVLMVCWKCGRLPGVFQLGNSPAILLRIGNDQSIGAPDHSRLSVFAAKLAVDLTLIVLLHELVKLAILSVQLMPVMAEHRKRFCMHFPRVIEIVRGRFD